MLSPCKLPTLDILIRMAKKEKLCRLSDKYIKECSMVAKLPNIWLKVTAKMQEEIVMEEGFVSELEKEIALNCLRRAHTLYPQEITFQDAIQVKNNLANKGKYNTGDILPNIILYTMNMKQINLYDTLNKKQRNLIIGSSQS